MWLNALMATKCSCARRKDTKHVKFPDCTKCIVSYCITMYIHYYNAPVHTSSLSLSKLPRDSKCWRRFWWLQPGAFLRSHIHKKTTRNRTKKVAKFPLPPNWPASRMEVSVDLKSLAMKLAVQCSLPGPGLAGAYRVIIWYIIGVQGDHIIQAVCRMCVQGDVNRTADRMIARAAPGGWTGGCGRWAPRGLLWPCWCRAPARAPHSTPSSDLCYTDQSCYSDSGSGHLTTDGGCCRSWHRGNTTVMRENTPW